MAMPPISTTSDTVSQNPFCLIVESTSFTTESLVAVAPTGTPDTVVDVVVTSSAGVGSLTGGFRYDAVPAPVLAAVQPAESLFHVATPLTLSGTGFDEHYPLSVTFAGVPATDVEGHRGRF